MLGVCVSHNASAALLRDGEVVVAIEKERLTRVKHHGGDETQAVRYCLDAAGIGMERVDLVVQNYLQPNARSCTDFGARYARGSSDLHMLFGADPALYEGAGQIVHVSHHHAHAWSAYGPSPFEDAAVLVMDQLGNARAHATDWSAGDADDPDHWHREVVSLYRAAGGRLQAVDKVFSPVGSRFDFGLGLHFHALGVGSLYAAVTRYCFDIFEDESGKVMAMAPFGRDVLAHVLYPDGSPLMDRHFEWTAAYRRPYDLEANREEYQDLCASAQAALERVVLAQAGRLHEQTGAEALCFAGGIALNCIVNKKILDRTPFQNLFVQPAANDAGIAIGAAMYGWHEILGQPKAPAMRHTFHGRPWSRAALDQAVAARPILRATELANPPAEAARRVAEGQIVGWFRGGSEFGPRALGHRSVLADPRNPETHHQLNQRVKRRPDFQPYAPSVLQERAAEWFELEVPSPYMLLGCQVRPEVRARIPAVVHIDGSARVQTVSAEVDPDYHALLSAFEALTGVPLVLNTSMNLRGEPIVETPAQALDFLITTGIEAVIVDGVLVERIELDDQSFGALRPVLAPGVSLERERSESAVRHLLRSSHRWRRTVGLNGPSYALLDRCDGHRTVAELVAELRSRRPLGDVAGPVRALIETLYRERLLDLRRS